MKVVLSEKNVNISAKLGQFLTIILLSFIYLNYVQIFSFNKEITTILSLLIVISISPLYFKERSLFLVFLFAITLCYAILRGRFTNSAWYLNKSLYWSLAAIFYGFLIVKREIIRWTLYIPILIVMLSVIVGAFFIKERIDGGSFFSMNRNTLALSVVVYSILITVSETLLDHTKISIFPSLIAIIVCVFSKSRAGLIISILYSLVVFLKFLYPLLKNDSFRITNIFKSKNKYIFIGIIIFLIVLFSVLGESRLFKEGLADNGRLTIYRSYINEVTAKKFIVGFQPTILQQFFSLHNSFLKLLADSGIAALIMFIVIFVGGIGLVKKSPFLLAILGCVLLYAQVEHMIFLRIGDFVLYPLLIYAFNKDEKSTVEPSHPD